MTTPINAICYGQFTSTGALVNISLPAGVNKFEMFNITDIGSSAASTPVMKATALSYATAGSAYYSLKTNGAATIALENTTTSGGFTFLTDSAGTAPTGATTLTGITNANPPVVSTANTGNLTTGSVVRIYGTTGQLQLAGMDFTVNTVVANTSFNLAYMGTPGSAASAGSWIQILFDPRYYPARRYITNITAASSAVITLSVTHGFTIGQQVRIICPAAFGMTQINGLQATVTAINTTNNTITVNINSTNFTAFTFPTSATAATGVTFAQVVPIGEAAINSSTQTFGNLLDDATRNTSINGIQIGTTVQTSGKQYQWFAYTGAQLS